MKINYLLSESLISTITVYLILKKLIQPWTEWDAFKLGIIDKNGKKLKHPVSAKERESWDMLTKVCWNLKKITSKYVGKGKYAQYMAAGYLLKDSLHPYIKHNQQKLNETLLSDMTYHKQLTIFNFLKELEHNNLATPIHNNLATPIHNNLVIEQHNNIVEFNIHKIINIVEDVLNKQNVFDILFEEATSAGDIASPDFVLGGSSKRIDPLKIVNKDLIKLKKKRKPKNESN